MSCQYATPAEMSTSCYHRVRGGKHALHTESAVHTESALIFGSKVFLNYSAIVFLGQKVNKKRKDCTTCVCQTNCIPLLARITNLYVTEKLAKLLNKKFCLFLLRAVEGEINIEFMMVSLSYT